ncbi:1306_t:CDS:2 [Entrophospora sp. SA101]|nr:1306_t:CDS:2 [Entrophospora sp. SA101]
MTKTIKPINNSSRNTILIDYREKLTPNPGQTPRQLLQIIKPQSGRNNQGRITTRHQGGGHKRYYRIIDFKRYENDGIVGKVKSIEYDPNRNCFISLISYQNGSFAFIITPEGLQVNNEIMSGPDESTPLKVGNNLPLHAIPVNTPIHNLELKPKKGGQLLRSAGTYGEIVGKEEGNKYVLVKLMSKEVRKVLANCRATLGKVSNSEANLVRLGKAGRSRWRGIRPTVRGSAMNPVDHPHGGGEQKAGIGHPSPLKKANQENKKSAFKTWARGSVISPEMIGHTLLIHNGKKFLSRQVTPEMVNHKIEMLIPKKTKYRYPHRTKYEGQAKGNKQVNWGQFGLQAQQVRMGSGKGAIDSWVAVVKQGTVMFEVSELDREIVYKALTQASHKLPKNNGEAKVKYKIIERNGNE